MEELMQDLVAANRILAEHGVIDAYGHVSVRSPQNPGRYWLARAIAPERVQAGDLLEYDLDSRPLEAQARESVRERFIHGEIYKTRPDVVAVVHNHSPSVIPFSVTGVPMRAIFHMAAFVGDGLPNFEIRDVQKGTDLLVKTPALGAALARIVADKPAALMRGAWRSGGGRDAGARGRPQRIPGDERAHADAGAAARARRPHHLPRRCRSRRLGAGAGIQPGLADVARPGA